MRFILRLSTSIQLIVKGNRCIFRAISLYKIIISDGSQYAAPTRGHPHHGQHGGGHRPPRPRPDEDQ